MLKSCQNKKEQKSGDILQEFQWQQRLIILSFLAIAIALAIRLLGYVYTSNLALAMETAHITFDAVLTFFVLVAIKVTRANFTKRFSYGLFKIEDLITLFIAVLIFYLGVDFLLDSFSALPALSGLAAVFELVSVVPLYIAGYVKIKAGRLMHAPSLRADCRHTYTDVYEGVGVSAGLLLYGISKIYVFYIIAIAMAFAMLVYTAYQIAKDALLSLLDLPKDKKTAYEITKTAESVKGIRKVKDIKVRWAGPAIFVELVVEMDPFMTIDEAHPITEIVEEKIKEKLESVSGVTVHVEPVERTRFNILIPVESESPNNRISNVLAKSKYFEIIEMTKKGSVEKIEKQYYLKNELLGKTHVGPDFRKLLTSYRITDIICLRIGEGIYGIICAKRIYCWKSTGDLNRDLRLFKEKRLAKAYV